MQELYVVYFESANYCGYGEHCLVWATDEDDARDKASDWADEFYREQDLYQYKEEYGNDDEDEEYLNGVVWASIMNVFPLASEEGEGIRGYLLDDEQKHFYQVINEKD
jgi:hypothetical protein